MPFIRCLGLEYINDKSSGSSEKSGRSEGMNVVGECVEVVDVDVVAEAVSQVDSSSVDQGEKDVDS